MDKNKKLKRVIGILIAIVILIIIVLLILLQNRNAFNSSSTNHLTMDNISSDNSINYDIYLEGKVPENFTIDTKVTEVTSINNYFVVKNIIDSYFSYCQKLIATKEDIDLYRISLVGEKLEKYIADNIAKEQQQGQEGLYNMLSSNYLNEFNISKADLKQKFGIKNQMNIVVEEMYVVQNSVNIFTYFITGKTIDTVTTNNMPLKIAVSLDMANKTYAIYPTEYLTTHGYDNITVGNKVELDIKRIENKKYNTFEYKNTQNDEICKEYFDNYQYIMLHDTKTAYDKLNKEYAQKRFGNIQSFYEYVNDNYRILKEMRICNYKINKYAQYTDYLCTDQYDNIYIFRQQGGGVMRYNVLLDNYTVMIEEDVQSYNSLNRFEKSKYNLVNKFIKQINTKDYTAIYNNLDSTFKENNFKTKDNLKQYIQNNMYELNSIEIDEYDNQTYDYYIFHCTITNVMNTKETKKMTVILDQGEDMNFTMSFSFN